MKLLIGSFSYAKGIKTAITESTPHGGGFVFDMRCIDNPGRLEEYRTLSGLDDPVRLYLEDKTEMPNMVWSIRALLNSAINGSKTKGYDELSVLFGCTGGQHRSVYAANQIGRLMKMAGHEVVVTHHNQDNWFRG